MQPYCAPWSGKYNTTGLKPPKKKALKDLLKIGKMKEGS